MLNMNFSERVVINTLEQHWVASPGAGVKRKRLAREEAEHGHATSIVCYEPGAHFSHHDHPLGEEIFVLSGIFSDQSGDYPAGTYFRNPEGFLHAPFSEEGCEIFVKLHQFQSGDDKHVCMDTNLVEWQIGNGNLEVLSLFELGSESVYLERWPVGEHQSSHVHEGGEEIYVISGELIDEDGRYPAGTWLRNPPMSRHSPYVERDTLLWVKIGHLGTD